MAADLRLVANPAQRHADELAPHRPRDRTAERGLSRPRRADEAQDRTLWVLLQLAHGEILENAILDLLQVVMVFVQHQARMRNIEVVLGRHRPGQVDQPFQIRADDGVLGGLGRDDAQPLQLRLGRLTRLGGQLRRFHFLAQLLDVAAARVALAQLLLDRAHLLAQVELFLVLRQLGLHLRLDLMSQLDQLELAVEDGRQLLQPRLDIQRAEQVLLLLHRDVEVRGDQIADLARVLDVHHHDLQLVGQVGDHGDELGELVHHVRLHGLDVLRRFQDLSEMADARPERGAGAGCTPRSRCGADPAPECGRCCPGT